MASHKRADLIAVVVVLAIVVAAGGGFLLHQHGAGGWPFAGGGHRQLYTCSMHPYYTSDRPGECPICGMTLVPVKKAAGKTTHEGHESRVAGMAAVEIDPRQQQLIGVTVALVKRKDVTRTVRAVGAVVPDERRMYSVSSKVGGWIEQLYVNATGQPVAAGQPMLAIYSPEVYSTQEEYRVADENAKALAGSPADGVAAGAEALRDAAARRLAYWDIAPGDIDRVPSETGLRKTFKVRTPYGGYVMEKHVEIGMYVEPGMPLYTIADLSRVWVEADVYEYELPYVQVGQKVEITLPYYPAEPLEGTVRFVYPMLDPMTRTGKVRVEVANPKLKLKPEMFANVALKQDLGEQLVVPESAVLDSGDEKVVFVVHGEGHFEPRVITVATKADDYYVVATGLKEGERVATSGNFLIDSESRIKGAIAGMASMPGMEGMSMPGTESTKNKSATEGVPGTSGHQH